MAWQKEKETMRAGEASVEATHIPTAPTAGLSAMLREMLARRDALRAELLPLERDLVEAGAIMAVSVTSAEILRGRARWHDGTSIASQIVNVIRQSPTPMRVRDVVLRVSGNPASVSAAFSRLVTEGEIKRVSHGVYVAGSHGNVGEPLAEREKGSR